MRQLADCRQTRPNSPRRSAGSLSKHSTQSLATTLLICSHARQKARQIASQLLKRHMLDLARKDRLLDSYDTNEQENVHA